MNPIIPWMGGKRRLVKQILPLFPEHTCYCEPFAGGGAMLFAKPPSKVEVLNDIDGELINFYRVIKHHMEEFHRQFKHALISRQIYDWLKETPAETLTDIQRASRFYYLQKLAFGAKSSGRHFGTATTAAPRLNLLRIEQDISDAHLRLQRCLVEHMSWRAVIKRYDRPHTPFYCDPPYHGTAGYGRPFDVEEYAAMAELARAVKGDMIISINDHPDIRAIFSGLAHEEVNINYTVSGKSTPARGLIYLSPGIRTTN